MAVWQATIPVTTSEETDARGHKTTYTVDGDTSRNEEVTDRFGNKTAYEYDDSGRTTKVTSAKPQYDENGNKKTDESGNIIYDDIANVPMSLILTTPLII